MPKTNNITKTKETIFAYDNQIIDLQTLVSKNIDILKSKLYFRGILLTGGIESSRPYNQYFFGELDSKDSNIGLDISKPIYHFIPKDSSNLVESMQDSTQTAESPNDSTDSTQTAESPNDSTDSTQTAQLDSKLLGTLKIYLDSHTLTLLNYDVFKVA